MSTRAILLALAACADSSAKILREHAAQAADAQDAADELVALTETKLESEPQKKLVRSGKLKTIQIGRKFYTSRRALAALVDRLPQATLPGPSPVAPVDDLGEAMARRRSRRVA